MKTDLISAIDCIVVYLMNDKANLEGYLENKKNYVTL